MTATARWKDLVVGYELPPYTTPPVTRTDFVRYQGASGDVNPAHHDDEFARAAGFPSAFAPGMYAAGVLGTYLTDSLGAQTCTAAADAEPYATVKMSCAVKFKLPNRTASYQVLSKPNATAEVRAALDVNAVKQKLATEFAALGG